MRRALVIEKRNDLLRQYWITNLLDWPDDVVAIYAVLDELVRLGVIDVVKYNKSNVKLVPWLYTIDLFDKNGLPLPANFVFPYPMANITNDRELDGYNIWLKNDFTAHVMKMNNTVREVPGWEGINYKHVLPFKPVKLYIPEYDLDRAETFASYRISENNYTDCCE